MIRKILFLLFLVGPLFAQTNTFIPGGGVNSQTNSYTATASDVGKIIKMNCAACSLTLPNPPPFANWTIVVKNNNATGLTVSPNGLTLDDNTSNQFINQGQWLQITTDGNVYTSLASGGGGSSTPVNLSLAVNPPSGINFGTVQNGTPTTNSITIQNTSASGVIVVSSCAFSGANATDFTGTLTLCNMNLAAGASFTFPITFTPSTNSAESATLTINSTVGTTTVPLSGTGQAAATFNLVISPSGGGSGTVQSGDGTSPCPQGQTCTPPTISAAWNGSICNGSCGNSYSSGTVVVLTGTATSGNPGSTFGGFTISGTPCANPCSVTMSANTTVAVSFTIVLPSSNITIVGGGQGGGAVTSDLSDASGIVNCGSTSGVTASLGGTGCTGIFTQGKIITFTTAPNGSSTNGGWQGAPPGAVGCTASSLTCAFPVPTTPLTLTAIFTPTTVPIAKADGFFVTATPTATTIAGSYTNAQHAGGMDVCFLETGGAVTVTGVADTNGNTWAALNTKTTNGTFNQIAWGVNNIAAGVPNTVTVTYSGTMTNRSMRCMSYDGIITGAGFVDATANGNGSSTTPASGTLTTTQGNDLLVCGTTSGSAVKNQDPLFVQQILDAPFNDDIEDRQGVPQAAGYNCQPTLSGSASWVDQDIAFKAQQTTGTVNAFSLTVVGKGNGNGTLTIPGATCTFTAGTTPGCSVQVAANSTPALLAAASSGSIFGGYGGVTGCSVQASCTVPSITSNTVLTVEFDLPTSSGPFNILNPPPVTNRPYPVAYFNKKLPNAGSGGPTSHLMPGSDANIVPTVMKNGGSSLITSSGFWNTPGTDDGQHRAFYYGQATDPVYQVNGCTGPSTSTSVNGQKFHAPSGAAYNQGSFDKEIALWDQTTDVMFQFYGGSAGPGFLPACSGTLSAPCPFTAYGGYCSAVNHTTGSGYDGGNGASTAGLAPMANIIRLTEIYQVGHINHGLRGVTTCTDTDDGTYPTKVVFPANVPSGSPSNTCANAGVSATHRPPNGALFFLDYTQAQLNCFDPTQGSCGGINKLTPWQFALIEAATFYGITLEDTGNGSSISLPGIESEQGYQFAETHGYPGAKAQADAFTTFMNANCSGSTCNPVQRCTLGDSTICANGHSQWQWGINAWANISLVGGLDVIGHMHVADPCVTISMQGLANDGHGTNACP